MKLRGLVLLLVVWALAPLLVSHAVNDLLVFATLYYLGGLGVGLALGQAGIVNLGQALFFGIGAYASGYFSTRGLPMPVGLLVGAVVSAGLAALLGAGILRLHGFFLGLATLALGIMGQTLFFEWDGITGGSIGIGGIPQASLFGLTLDSAERYYYFVGAVAIAVTWMANNLMRGRSGLMMRAARDSAEATLSLGISLHRLRTAIFMLCALLGSLAGSLFAHYATFVSVDSFGLMKSLTFLLVPVLGGMRSWPGMVAGALFVTFVPYLLSRLGDIHQVLFGLAMIAVVVVLPDGLSSLAAMLRDAWRARRPAAAPQPDAQALSHPQQVRHGG